MLTNTNFTKLLSLFASSLCIASMTGNAMAKEHHAEKKEWKENHPRRAQVNRRLDNQNKRINNEVKEGEMSKAEARKLHKEDRQIRQEERAMASQNGGHITKQEQKTLNQQENAVSREIGK